MCKINFLIVSLFLFFNLSALHAQTNIVEGTPATGTLTSGTWNRYIFRPSQSGFMFFRSSGTDPHQFVVQERTDNGAWREILRGRRGDNLIIYICAEKEYRINLAPYGFGFGGNQYHFSIIIPGRHYATESDFSFTLARDNISVVITRYIGPSWDVGTLIIPSTIQGLPVSEIGPFAFSNEAHFNRRTDSFFASRRYNHEIIHVYIPDSVKIIGAGAFFANRLFTVNIPDSVTTIGNYAFYLCENLTEVTLPDNVTNWGRNIFTRSGLGNIVFPSNMSKIPPRFVSGTQITNLIIPEGITEIGEGAFANCRILLDVTLPTTLETIGDSAFSGCIALTEILIPNSVISIGERAFRGSTSLRSIIIPEGITTIKPETFFGCTALQSITLPSTIIYIGAGAFGNCRAIREIVIPDSVESIRWGGQYRPRTSAFDSWATDSRPFGGAVLPLALQARLRQLGYGFRFCS